MEQQLPKHPFWDFSTQLYGKEIVKLACLHCQDSLDMNVNVVLLACWYAQSGRGTLDMQDFHCINQTIGLWHRKITQPLRDMRKLVNQYNHITWCQTISKDILDDEIVAEHIEQLLLADRLQRTSFPFRTALQKAKDAIGSLQCYARTLNVKIKSADESIIRELLSVVFPKIAAADLERMPIATHKMQTHNLNNFADSQVVS